MRSDAGGRADAWRRRSCCWPRWAAAWPSTLPPSCRRSARSRRLSDRGARRARRGVGTARSFAWKPAITGMVPWRRPSSRMSSGWWTSATARSAHPAPGRGDRPCAGRSAGGVIDHLAATSSRPGCGHVRARLGARRPGRYLLRFGDLAVHAQAAGAVVRQGVRAIQAAGVQPDPASAERPGATDGGGEQMAADALADEARQQAELDDLDVVVRLAASAPHIPRAHRRHRRPTSPARRDPDGGARHRSPSPGGWSSASRPPRPYTRTG